MLAGIGFTMSIFIALLAFNDPLTIDTAKVAILCGSVLSCLTGVMMLFLSGHKSGERYDLIGTQHAVLLRLLAVGGLTETPEATNQNQGRSHEAERVGACCDARHQIGAVVPRQPKNSTSPVSMLIHRADNL